MVLYNLQISIDIHGGNKLECEIKSICIYSLFIFISQSHISIIPFNPMLYIVYKLSLFLGFRLKWLSSSIVLYFGRISERLLTHQKNKNIF